MAETLIIAKGDKEDKYKTLLPQIKSIVECEDDTVANMANTAAAIFETFRHLWVGFYIVRQTTGKPGSEELVLGPFQGSIACTRIRKGRGVCGTAWSEGRTLVVPDVDLFPGHIACSSLSRSEIVVPIFNREGKVVGVLDIDSETTDTFDSTDARWLEDICRLIEL